MTTETTKRHIQKTIIEIHKLIDWNNEQIRIITVNIEGMPFGENRIANIAMRCEFESENKAYLRSIQAMRKNIKILQ
jgi:hypothetical protein